MQIRFIRCPIVSSIPARFVAPDERVSSEAAYVRRIEKPIAGFRLSVPSHDSDSVFVADLSGGTEDVTLLTDGQPRVVPSDDPGVVVILGGVPEHVRGGCGLLSEETTTDAAVQAVGILHRRQSSVVMAALRPSDRLCFWCGRAVFAVRLILDGGIETARFSPGQWETLKLVGWDAVAWTAI